MGLLAGHLWYVVLVDRRRPFCSGDPCSGNLQVVRLRLLAQICADTSPSPQPLFHSSSLSYPVCSTYGADIYHHWLGRSESGAEGRTRKKHW